MKKVAHLNRGRKHAVILGPRQRALSFQAAVGTEGEKLIHPAPLISL